MHFKKWLYILVIIAFAAALFTGFHILSDPFGVSKDIMWIWHPYGMVSNPSTAKSDYAEEYAGKYNAFILGGDSAGFYNIHKLNEYSGYSFYNMSANGCDICESCDAADFLMDRFDVKCLLLNIGIQDLYGHAENAGTPPECSDRMEKISRLPGSLKYAFTPAVQGKISLWEKGLYGSQVFHLYQENGSYYPSIGDVLAIGDMKSYLEDHRCSGFLKGDSAAHSLPTTDECLKALASLKKRCDKKGVKLIVVFEPTYAGRLSGYKTDEIKSFLSGIADITEYWCFSFNSVCDDCRYFYDIGHFRNAAGTMAMVRMFGDKISYTPGDFGVYATKDNIQKYLESVSEYLQNSTPVESDSTDYTAEVKILLYHNVTKDGNDAYSVSEEVFAAHMKALCEVGYKTISFEELIQYVENGVDIPENAVIITFDDGYSGVYGLAFPILREYGMKATVFVIGVSVGKDTNKGTDIPITPHFSYAEAQEMIDSGLISIQTHTYDMHMAPKYDGYDCRVGVLQNKNETRSEYINAFKSDLSKAILDIERNTTETVDVLSYPYGQFSVLSEMLSAEMGIKITLTTTEGSNTVIKGLPQSLRELKRYGVVNSSPDELLQMLSK